MTLKSPFEISARLLPALRIGKAFIQLEYSRRPGSESRTRYRWTLDLRLIPSLQKGDLPKFKPETK